MNITTEFSTIRPGRLRSLDFMRGLTIAAMVLVNNNGDARAAYWPLLHSRWNGWTPTDIVFPAFLFMVGMSLHLSLGARLSRGVTRRSLFRATLRRALWLFLLGLLVNTFPHFDLLTLRIPGVLQRIAICSVAAAALNLWTSSRTIAITALILLLGYWVLLVYVPVPGFGIPAHRHMPLDPRNNLPAWLDRRLFPGHLYRDGTYDPEGLLSTLPAIANTLLGSLAAVGLSSQQSAGRKLEALCGLGALFIAAAQLWSQRLPFNKRLWTSSYALLAAGISCLLLAACFWLIDMHKRNGRALLFFEVFGTNAIFAYLLSELLAATLDNVHVYRNGNASSLKQIIVVPLIEGTPSASFGSLVYSLSFVLVCFCFTWLLYRKQIFLRL